MSEQITGHPDTLAVMHSPEPAALCLTGHTRVPEPELAALWDLYLRSFGGLATRAALHHLMDADQFRREMSDPRITKFVVSQGTEPIGLLTITADLHCVEWISPDFYRPRYPGKAARGEIYYVTNMLTDPGFQGREAFNLLTAAACREAAGGVICFDVCESNARRGFAEAVRKRVSRLFGGDIAYQVLDSQTFYGIDLTGPLVEEVDVTLEEEGPVED